MNKSIIFILILVFSAAEIIPFNDKAIDLIFTQKSNALFLFTSTNDQSNTALSIFQQIDTSKPQDVVLTQSDSNDGHKLFQRLGQYLGVDTSTTPKILYLSKNNVKYLFDGELTIQSVSQFLTLAKENKISTYLKSDPIPQTNDQPVKIIVGKMFQDYVLNSNKEFLIQFYAPWCGHCKHLAPKYDEVAKMLQSNPNIVLAKVDSTKNEIEGVSISGYPTLKFWRSDKTLSPIDFDGQRQVDGMINWLKEKTQFPWVQEAAQTQL